MTDTVSISAKCTECGGDATWPDDATELTRLTCGKCGKDLGSYGDFEKAAHKKLKDKIEGEFRKAFGGTKTIKIKI